jgi:microsomal epoxide hydrolase
MKKQYNPTDLPYHLIVPSLPGYAFSSGPPLQKDFDPGDVARIIDKLLVGLGFGNGYVAQGGDVGSRVAQLLSLNHAACKAIHRKHQNPRPL